MDRHTNVLAPFASSSSSLSFNSGHSQLAAQNKRKEKARIAARVRRSQEANIITEMANELHITQEKMRRIDKTTIIKLAIDYIKAFEILCREPPRHKLLLCTDYNDENNNQNESCQARNGLTTTQNRRQQQQPLIESPNFSTASIFEPKTIDNSNSHYLMIENEKNGKSSFVLKPDTEILDGDDLTHLAPQAGDISISLDVEPLDNIILDDKTTSLFVQYDSNPSYAGSKNNNNYLSTQRHKQQQQQATYHLDTRVLIDFNHGKHDNYY